MKTRLLIIFGASVGVFVILLGLTILSEDSNNIQHEQMCADLFDANMNAFSKIVGEQEDLELQMHYGTRQNELVFHSEFFKEWRDYDCIETVNDWVDISEYKNYIREVLNWDDFLEFIDTECDYGFKNIDGVCKQLGKIREKDIGVFFEIQLMELGIEWELADRSWANPDFEIAPPARICSQIIKDSGAELYISTIWQDEYSLSDMIIQEDMPDDCVKFFPVTQVGRK